MPTLAFPARHALTDVHSRAYLDAAAVDRLRLAARRVGRHVSSLPVRAVAPAGQLTFRTPSDTDPRIFQGAFLAQQCPAVLCFRRMRGDEPSAFPPGE
jgi:hypothetical protein